MSILHEQEESADPDRLVERAREFLGACDDFDLRPADSTAEMTLRRAYLHFAGDLDALDRTAADGDAVRTQFGVHLHEKLAALLFIARCTLLELADPPPPCLDIDCARLDMTLYVEILVKLGGLDGLGALYDFAAEQRRSAAPNFWPDVCRHFLSSVRRIPAGDVWLRRFLADRPGAQQLLQEVAGQAPAGEDPRQGLPAAAHLPADPLPYLRLYEQYRQDQRSFGIEGLCCLVAAKYRIEQAFMHGDLPAITRWFAEGSPCAVRTVLRRMERELPSRGRARLLQEFLHLAECDLVRRAAVVLELGTINLAECPEGGQTEINRVLVDCAMTDDGEQAGVARVAVRELVTVRNEKALLFIAARAPLLPVAEEAVLAMMEMRRLRQVEPLLNARPELRPIYRTAYQHLVEIERLVEAVWSAATPEAAESHLESLKTLRAYPELDRLTELLQWHQVVL